jgi:DUF1680 family protein
LDGALDPLLNPDRTQDEVSIMKLTRRTFVDLSLKAGGLILLDGATGKCLRADTAEAQAFLKMGRMAPTPATAFRPYVSAIAKTPTTYAWVQIDLGSTLAVNQAVLYPAFEGGGDQANGYGSPVRFRLEGSATEDFSSPTVLADLTQSAIPNPNDQIVGIHLSGATVRYVRLVPTELRAADHGYQLALAKISIFSNDVDAAESRPVSIATASGEPALAQQLTRKPRPMGEGIVTDNAHNVTAASTWKRVPFAASVPLSGVKIGPGIFERAMRDNIVYLLSSYSVDEMLRPFRERAGKPVSPDLRKPVHFWDTDLPGSSAGRFMMGAGNTLRWIKDDDLNRSLDHMVAGIAECKMPDGYIMAYPRETILYSERGGYTRSWVTHGLLEAGYSGHQEAFALLRGYYDWFDHCEYLPRMMRGGSQGVQGMIANTRMHLSPVGKPEDIQVIQRYYQENYWLEGLAAHDKDLVWQYPYDRPHNYLITDFEAYLDLYIGTGDERYLKAVLGAWDLYHDHWEHVGGSIAITEFGEFPPDSYRLLAQAPFDETGELCGSAFWIKLNQRLHLLYPREEKYVAEIEKSIYNIVLANQVGTQGFDYHARLVGYKGDHAVTCCTNSCCEGQGTRIVGSLPEYIYSTADDGLYVNLFENAAISWLHQGVPVEFSMASDFPNSGSVSITCSVREPVAMTLYVRIPSWAVRNVEIAVNAERFSGAPGSYLPLTRTWKNGDLVRFDLPMTLRVHEYSGTDQIAGKRRFALEYGPVLMAAVAEDVPSIQLAAGTDPRKLASRLNPRPYEPLQFDVEGLPGVRYMPYWRIRDERFTCFPVIESRST